MCKPRMFSASSLKVSSTCKSILSEMRIPVLQIQISAVGQQQLLCDVSSGRRRPLIPLSWRRKVFQAVHTLAHPGIRPPEDSYPAGSCERALPPMSAIGARTAWPVKEPRSQPNRQLLCNLYQSQAGVSHISTWTWWAL